MQRTHDSPAKDLCAQSADLGRGHDAPRRLDQAPLHARGPNAGMRRWRILIVEDDVTVGPLLAEMFEDLGHVVCAVEIDVADAAAASARLRPDLMIVDVGLGEVRGVAQIEQILRDVSVPCVFVTDDTLRVPSRVPGAVLVRKPFRTAEIVAAIHRAMDGRPQRS